MTGLTSNPTIFEKAIGSGTFYDQAIGELTQQGESGEDLFFALALQDLRQARGGRRRASRATPARGYRGVLEVVGCAAVAHQGKEFAARRGGGRLTSQ